MSSAHCQHNSFQLFDAWLPTAHVSFGKVSEAMPGIFWSYIYEKWLNVCKMTCPKKQSASKQSVSFLMKIGT